jgi:hypothetical protein
MNKKQKNHHVSSSIFQLFVIFSKSEIMEFVSFSCLSAYKHAVGWGGGGGGGRQTVKKDREHIGRRVLKEQYPENCYLF